MSDPKIETVQRIYAAFGRGDAEAILAEVADEVDWAGEASQGGAPWYGARSSKADIRRFFDEIAKTISVSEFTPLSFASNETDVFAVIRFGATATSTGKSGSMNLHHWWRFRDGKVVQYRGTEDTALTASLLS